MRLLFLCLSLVLLPMALSQEPSQPSDVDNDDDGFDPAAQALDITRALGSDHNYTVEFSVTGNGVRVDNLTLNPQTILMVRVNRTRQQFHNLMLEPGESRMLTSDLLHDATKCYFISLTPFGVTPSAPALPGMQGLFKLGVSTPGDPLDTVLARTPEGAVINTGIDGNGNVHYPIFGSVLGVLDPNQGIILPDGNMLPFVKQE